MGFVKPLSRYRWRFCVVIAVAPMVSISCRPGSATTEHETCRASPLWEAVRTDSTLRVIAHLAGDFRSETELGAEAVVAQRRKIADIQDRVLTVLEGSKGQLLRRPEELPFLVLMVNEDALCRLLNSNLVARVDRDDVSRPTR